MELIKRDTDYALRSVIYMATFPFGTMFNMTTVSENTSAPKYYIQKIFQKLSKAKILQSQRGKDGGYSFLKKPKNITVLDIVKIIQGPPYMNICTSGKNRCARQINCSLNKKLLGFQQDLTRSLENLSLLKLAKEIEL